MQRASMVSRLQGMARTLKPGLRVIGLAYTGLGGMLAVVLVASAALVPVSPVLQIVAEPARLAVSNLLQPTSDAITTLFIGPGIRTELPALHELTAFAATSTVDVAIEEAVVEDSPQPQLLRPVALARVVAAAVPAPAAAPETVDEITGVEPGDISAARAIAPVAEPAAPVILQIASQDVPKPLAPLPVPTETALQHKARLDAVNQAAIDAAKAALARAKADADAANNAAIATRKASASAPSPVAVPSIAAPVAAPTSSAQSKAAANAANQAAIDAAHAKALATKTPPTPSAQPPPPAPSPASPPPSTPTAQSAPTSSPVASQQSLVQLSEVGDVGDAGAAGDLDAEGLLENTPIDLAAEPSDSGAA